MNLQPLPKDTIPKQPTITVDPTFNPFEKKVKPQFEIPLPPPEKHSREQWQALYDPLKEIDYRKEIPTAKEQHVLADWDAEIEAGKGILSLLAQNRYIVSATRSGIIIVDPGKARERIFFERCLNAIENDQPSMQRQLHPQTLSLTPEDFEMVAGMKDVIGKAGFEIREFGKNTVLIEAIPAGCQDEDVKDLFEGFLEGLKTGTSDAKTRIQLRVARSPNPPARFPW